MTLKHPDVASRTEYSLPFSTLSYFFYLLLGAGGVKKPPCILRLRQLPHGEG